MQKWSVNTNSYITLLMFTSRLYSLLQSNLNFSMSLRKEISYFALWFSWRMICLNPGSLTVSFKSCLPRKKITRPTPFPAQFIQWHIPFYYIDTDEITGFFLLLKSHIFIARSEDTINFLSFTCEDIGVAMVTNINFDFSEQKI